MEAAGLWHGLARWTTPIDAKHSRDVSCGLGPPAQPASVGSSYRTLLGELIGHHRSRRRNTRPWQRLGPGSGALGHKYVRLYVLVPDEDDGVLFGTCRLISHACLHKYPLSGVSLRAGGVCSGPGPKHHPLVGRCCRDRLAVLPVESQPEECHGMPQIYS